MPYMKMIFAAPRTGKSTHAAREAIKAIKKGIPVYSNYPIKGCMRLDISDIGKYQLQDCLLIIDEAGAAYNSRAYKSFPREALEFFKLHGHYRVSCLFYSQGWDDCDKIIRTLCTAWYNMTKIGPITLIHEFRKKVDVDEETHQIIDQYFKSGFLRGGLRFLFRPLYYKYFDSWEAPRLADKTFEPWFVKPVPLPKK